MSIRQRTLKDGTIVYDVCEYTGFTLAGKRDRTTITCATKREAEREQIKLLAQRDAMRNKSGRMKTAGQT